jgi:hypothetical protein
MIRNVILHLHNEQPMKADIESLPTAADAGLLCTNLRTLEGRKPLSTEYLDSVFLIPYNIIRFIEIPRASIEQAGRGTDLPIRPVQLPAEATAVGEHPSVIITPPPAEAWPAEAAPEEEQGEALEHLEPDAELLRRIREA